MQITDGIPKFKAVSGYVNHIHIAEVMNIHQRSGGITPLSSTPMGKHPINGGIGSYLAFSAQIKKAGLIKLNVLMDEMMVDGEYFKEGLEELTESKKKVTYQELIDVGKAIFNFSPDEQFESVNQLVKSSQRLDMPRHILNEYIASLSEHLVRYADERKEGKE